MIFLKKSKIKITLINKIQKFLCKKEKIRFLNFPRIKHWILNIEKAAHVSDQVVLKDIVNVSP